MEYHPYQQPNKLIEYCRKEDIAFQGYSPLAKGQTLSNPTINELAHKYGRTPAQICIRWSIQVEQMKTFLRQILADLEVSKKHRHSRSKVSPIKPACCSAAVASLSLTLLEWSHYNPKVNQKGAYSRKLSGELL